MDVRWDFPDPLALNVQKQLQFLLDLIPSDSPYAAVLQGELSSDTLLPTLSRMMRRPSLTLAVAWAFRPLLLDLCARWVDDEDDTYEKLEALGLLIEMHEELYPILSTFLRSVQFEGGPLRRFLNDLVADVPDTKLLHGILLAYYRIVNAAPSLPRDLNWTPAPLLKLFSTPHPDRGVCWLAIRCFALQSDMSDARRGSLEREVLGELGADDCTVQYGEDVSGVTQEIDGWLLPALESKRIEDYRLRFLDSPDYFSTETEPSVVRLCLPNLSSRIIDVYGVLFLRTPQEETPSTNLVLTASALVSLRKLAIQVSLRCPSLLTSASSSGKTTLLSHLARLLHPSRPNQIVTIHLADTSLDPRSLLGSHISSSTQTGAFEWRDGVLVKAMREGKWVIFKDIDRASSEVLGLIGPLVESLDDNKPIGSRATLTIPNRGEVEATESFALFATRSVETTGLSEVPPALFFGAQKWREVRIPENSLDELRLIVEAKFPNLSGPLADSLILIWQSVRQIRSSSSARPIGLRDLEKFCGRVSSLVESANVNLERDRIGQNISETLVSLLPNPSLREDLYLEARDVFFAAGATNKTLSDQRAAIASFIGSSLGLTEEACEWVLKRRTPAFDIEKDIDGRPIAVRAGRILLPVNPARHMPDAPAGRSFNMHKQAVRLMAQLAACIAAQEPVLLTGETGTGKTSVITHFASLLNRPLVSLNLSNQSESSDLIGGYRPVSARIPALELQQRFLVLFRQTFSSKKNVPYSQSLQRAISDSKWKLAVKLWVEASKMALSKLKNKSAGASSLQHEIALEVTNPSIPRKRRKLEPGGTGRTEVEWTAFEEDVHHFEIRFILDSSKFAFQFIEGPLLEAIRTGAWILLDEINLASPETLECIAGVLQGPGASITLTEQGSLEPIPRHPDFRLFACMNPATDVGKKDLPNNIRARFTEIDVPPPDDDQETLLSIISHYVGHLSVSDKAAIFDVAQFYTSVKRLSESGEIADGSGRRPHYSMRALSRALTFTADTIQSFGLRRAMWEGFTMAFTMVLDLASAEVVLGIAERTLLHGVRTPKQFLLQPSPASLSTIPGSFSLGPFWLSPGPKEQEEPTDYILTASVQKKLVDLARIMMTKRYPILIEGPTSSGKTSAIQYLARRSGHNFVRINNHEHTDIQEYLGSYVSDADSGKLVFRDGLLVRALRRGDWVVLDELNLAPTDVLEALNRLLDDNRELVIPETHEVVKPHPEFILFATQNPSGVYAGRKVLSRAFRNRFLEVHFDDVPADELETILCQRTRIPPSYSQRIVAVFHELQKRRQIGRIFEGKQGFATLRDLFRWAGRDAQGYQELADNGYMLLAERTRRSEDKRVVKDVIENVMKVSISEDSLYDLKAAKANLLNHGGIVWTGPMQRLFVLVSRALQFNEPVLLVGETGSGKTSVCQIYADSELKAIRTVNCHQNTEASDIIGGLRPVRNPEITLGPQQEAAVERVFLGWQDGPLVSCMRSGDVFLLDEISLADDSVLERLNSVLESSRTLILAERGGSTHDYEIVANDGFKFIATMNPGGDFGKKELSPALRNRFTEIWVPSVMEKTALRQIVGGSWKHPDLARFTEHLLDFIDWVFAEVKDDSVITLRDILSWVSFCNSVYPSSSLTSPGAFIHGGHMAVIDGLPSLTQLSSLSTIALQELRQRASRQLETILAIDETFAYASPEDVSTAAGVFRIGPFTVPLGSLPSESDTFNFGAPTSRENALRLIRASQIIKPILLEGSPGVGKTSLVAALAAASRQQLCRINLSEQTDLVDLFGSDLPDGSLTAQFTWTDGEFLRALKNGYWVLLDEMNLASQSVLEGLNAVFDHRGTVYIPELDRSFVRHPNFRIFAAQNPMNQGSGRKGLPKSFLNRFTKVFVEQLSAGDLLLICQHRFPSITTPALQMMIDFNCHLHDEVVTKRSFGSSGSPWEFNLRDIIRWATLLQRGTSNTLEPWKHLETIYACRFRTEEDRQHVYDLFTAISGIKNVRQLLRPRLVTTPDTLYCGNSSLSRRDYPGRRSGACLVSAQLSNLEAAMAGISENWLVIVTGPQGSGKTSFVQELASLAGQPLHQLSLSGSSDTSDLIGGFEQVGNHYSHHRLFQCLLDFIDSLTVQGEKGNIDRIAFMLQMKDEMLRVSQSQAFDRLETIAREVIASVPVDGTLETAKVLLENALSQAGNEGTSALRFEWIDGPLVQALTCGSWLLLDNANLCSSSVLDRLNSLCEMGGSLVLTEKGADQIPIIPHRDFRLIMTVNPQFGELSRAMRNRGIEIALNYGDFQNSSNSLSNAYRLPTNQVSVLLPASHRRIVFELSRRALLLPPIQEQKDNDEGLSNNRVVNDSLSTCVKDFMILVFRSEPSAHTGLLLLLYGSIVCTCPRYVLRLLKALGPRTQRLLEDTCLLLDKDNGLLRNFIHRLANGFLDGQSKVISLLSRSKHRPPLQFLIDMTTTVNWLPEADLEVCKVVSISLEMYALAIILDNSLLERAGKSDTETPWGGSTNFITSANEPVQRFLTSIPALVRKVLNFEYIRADNSLLVSLQLVLRLVHYAQCLLRAASNSTTDYSTLYALSGWICDSLDGAAYPVSEIREHAWNMRDSFTLTTGRRLIEMWNAFYSRPKNPQVLAIERKLQSIKYRHPLQNPAVGGDRLGIRVVEIIALQTAECGFDERGIEELDELIVKADKFADIVCQEVGDENNDFLPITSLPLVTVELDLLARINPYAHQKAGLNEVITLISKSSGGVVRHFPRLVAYQQLLWKVDAGKPRISELVRAHLEWHGVLWRADELLQTSGSSALLTPVLLQSTLMASSMSAEGRILQHFDVYEALIEDDIRRALLECTGSLTRREQLTALFLQNIVLLCACFPSLFDIQLLTQLQLQIAKAFDPEEVVATWQSILHTCKDPTLVAMFTSIDVPKVVYTSESRFEWVYDMGCCWISLSQAFLFAYVPDISLDPIRIQHCRKSFNAEQDKWVRLQINLQILLETIRTGGRTNIFVKFLEERLHMINHDLDAQNLRDYPQRSGDDSELHAFWTEARSFVSGIVSANRLENYIAVASQDAEACRLQEELLQNSVSNFLQRMRKLYGSYQDLLPAIELSLVQLRFGLRLVRHSTVVRATVPASSALRDITGFPSVRANQTFVAAEPLELSIGEFTTAHSLLFKLVSLVNSASWTARDRCILKQLRSTYEHLFLLWEGDCKAEAERRRHEESLFHTRGTEKGNFDSNEADEEIKRLFPTFEEAEDETDSPTQPPNIDWVRSVDPEVAKELLKVHLCAFGRDEPLRNNSRSSWESLRLQLAKACIDTHLVALPAEIDDCSLSLRLALLQKSRASLKENKEGSAYSFYRDPNVFEARRAAEVIHRLRDDLCRFIIDWPDQLVLQHLRDRCDSLLELFAASPVAKILGALERLLLHTEDWEMFAHRDNSLKVHRQALISLIVEWRKLELSGWRSLLDAEAEEFCSGLVQWWFRIYDATLRGAIAAGHETSSQSELLLNQYLDSLTPLLDDFMVTSPLGEFKKRLALLQSFASLTAALADIEDDHSSAALRRTNAILVSICFFYGQYTTRIGSSLTEQRAIVEKDIQGLVQLANWRDVNVHALQQSAQHTHKQLYRRLHKFREVLRQPVLRHLLLNDESILGEAIALDSSTDVGTLQAVNGLPTDIQLAMPVDGQIARVLGKFETVLGRDLGHLFLPFSTKALETLSTSICVALKDFSSASPPVLLSIDERKKWVSSLLTRKKRSWNELLKEMKRIGIPSNVKPEVIAMINNRRQLMEQPVLTVHDGFMNDASQRINSYFYRSVAILSELQDATKQHHQDISTRDIQRGIAYFQSSFSLAIVSRTKLQTLVADWVQISSIANRLYALEGAHSSCVGGSQILSVLRSAKVKSIELVEAIKEIISTCGNLAHLSEDLQPVDESALSVLRKLEQRSSVVEMSLDRALREVESSSPEFILEGELTAVRDALEHFKHTSAIVADLGNRDPKIRKFCKSFCEWESNRTIETIETQSEKLPSEPSYDVQSLVNLLLVVAQDLLAIEKAASDTDGEGHIKLQTSQFASTARALNADLITSHLRLLTTSIQSRSTSLTALILRRVLPFLVHYIAFYERFLSEYASWSGSLFKLTYISGVVVRKLALDGYCKPQEEDSKGATNASDSTDGVGLGEGPGNDNISKGIDDESQYEGLQNQDENKEGGRQNENSEDEALDVDFDLSGDLEDGDLGSHDEDDADLPADLDDAFGHDDTDALNPVNEEFWNNDQNIDEQSKEKIEGNGARHGEESEVIAKEDSPVDETGGSQEKLPGSDEDPAAGVDDVDGSMEQAEVDEVDGAAPSLDVGDDHAEIPPAAQDSLPDPEPSNDLESCENVDGGEDDVSCTEEPLSGPELQTSDNEDDGHDPDMDPNDSAQDESFEQMEGQDRTDTEVGASADVQAGAGSTSAQVETRSRETAAELSSQAAEESVENGAISDSRLKDWDLNSNDADNAGMSKSAEDTKTTRDDAKAESGGTNPGRMTASNADAPIPNPMRNLGDALREVRRRFEEIMPSTGSDNTVFDPSDLQPKTIEYASADAMDIDMEALGPAEGQETAKLNNLHVVDDAQEARNDDALPPIVKIFERQSHPNPLEADIPRPISEDDTHDGGRVNIPTDEKAVTGTAESMEVDNEPLSPEAVGDLAIATDELTLEANKEVETQLNRWLREGQPEADGRRMWQLYDSLTQSLSFSLCEQLRLILEPTRATRLMGDFRTGKRLNMKKIIPYIASNYTKDKIWLRRVKPSQREYQVLIALDDSRSMAESHSIHLAFQTLALVSKALNRLEVGDLAVASFGESTQILHGFDDGPFTDQAGTSILEAFGFQQGATDVRALLETSVDVLTTARERRSSSSNLWQLEIIISDGICQDHEALRAIMRKAEEAQILIVFIVIDALDASSQPATSKAHLQNSIIQMNQATYKTVNGQLELQMQRYLDSFPFEYFVVLSDVEALPDVLSDTLRQFFERLSAE